MYRCIWEVEISSKEQEKEVKSYYYFWFRSLPDRQKSADEQLPRAGQSEQSGLIGMGALQTEAELRGCIKGQSKINKQFSEL